MVDKKRKVLKIDNSKEPEKFKFVVRSGQTFGIARLRPGTEVELTVAEALPFSDKLEPADRSYAFASDATPEELADAGYEQVLNPSSATTDRDVMTPKQRAETSQTTSAAPPKEKEGTSAKTEAAKKKEEK